MNKFTCAALGVAAAGLAGTAVAAVPQSGSATPARATSHTLALVAHQTASHNVSPTAFVGADTDRSPTTHKVLGYDSITGHFNLKTGVVKIDAAVALKGGLITAHLTGKGQSNTLDGIITGGTGRYQGIHGTVHTTASGKLTHISFKYHL
jgi:hypothetical protein